MQGHAVMDELYDPLLLMRKKNTKSKYIERREFERYELSKYITMLYLQS